MTEQPRLLTEMCSNHPTNLALMAALAKGFHDHQAGHFRCPYRYGSNDAQAWDIGAMLAERYFNALAELEPCSMFGCDGHDCRGHCKEPPTS